MSRPEHRTRTLAATALLTLTALLTAACTQGGAGGDDGGGGNGGAEITVRILAGSELEDTAALLERAAEETGVRAEITWTGTLDASRLLASGGEGGADAEAAGNYDAAWLATNDYLRLHPGSADVIVSETPVATSPVALGVRREAMDRLGWDAGQVTWEQVHRAAADGELTFGMTDPVRSNSGYSALISVASALSGAQSALTAENIDDAAGRLEEFFTGQRLTSGSSGWLAEAFTGRTDVDALINYESVLLSLNRDHDAGLSVVLPTDGVVSARYPLTTLASASPEARDALRTLAEWLREEEAQRALTEDTLRRPVIPEVTPAEAIPDEARRELPYPGSLEIADGLLEAFDSQLRRPSRTVYVLDVSGSMEGERLAGLKAALRRLTGTETDGTAPGETFREREEVTLMPFSTSVVFTETHTVDPADPDAALAGIRETIDGLYTLADTNVYGSLMDAYDLLGEESLEGTFTSIVLMTDGESNYGPTAGDFTEFHNELPAARRTVPVFTVLFGDAAPEELEGIAAQTGGEVFDAVNGSLDDAFREIRGYQ
ncbi:VWA domain-containing protein [Streptomyces aidingensis]|uniref:Ca-activated chloride channel family protein n=1 Tax=Streptomyces aidingensis TaxID=910347 RepID=A0A1I1K6W1_9ACTN|nr:VWA domain-containing protein [Streptomyces aidingensis]SFC56325.1 Ca-activated chloride channel family protein [Streptomyces aidingensis]